MADAAVKTIEHRRWPAAVLVWLAPSVTATAVAALAAGALEAGLDGGGALRQVTSIGVATGLAGPILLGLLTLARLVWRTWRPRLIGPAVDEPRVWAWLGFGLLAAAALAIVTFNAVWWLARATAFKPIGVSLLLPVLIVPATAALAVLSQPAVAVLAAAVRAIDARWQRWRGRPLATARRALVAALALTVLVPAAAWWLIVRPRLGYIEMTVVRYPIAAALIAVVAQVLAARVRPRVALFALALALVPVAVAGWARLQRPVLLLEIWARPTVAGAAVDRVFDLDSIRRDLSVRGFAPVARPGAAHPDVLLITIDTLRADRTPLLGGPAAMANLAAFGQRGVVFEWAFAPGNVTRRSIPTIATGASATRLRGRVVGWAYRLDPRHVVVAERFRAAGYDTAGFFCCDSFFNPRGTLGLNRGLGTIAIERDGSKLAALARTWVRARERAGDRRPRFIWIHLIEMHEWVDLSRDLAGGGDRQRYDHVLSKVDGILGAALAIFGDRPPARAPITVVTADHGEGLGDHDAPFHSSDLYNSQIRVPLVIAGPGIAPGRRREPVGLVDLAPTLLDLAGFVPPGMPAVDGRSLADLVTGRRADEPDGGLATAAMVKDRYNPSERRAIVRGRWKLIVSGGRTELYDLHVDPNELRDLAASQPAELAAMRALFEARRPLDAQPAFITSAP